MNKKIYKFCLSALFASCIVIGSQLYIPSPLVPINAALLVVHCAAIVMNVKYSIVTVLIYLFLGFIGLPVFSGFTGGPIVLFGATGGYLIGYLASASIVSFGVQQMKHTTFNIFVCCMLGTLGCYALGTLWVMQVTQMNWVGALTFCVLPFIPGDIIKSLAATLLAKKSLLKKRVA